MSMICISCGGEFETDVEDAELCPNCQDPDEFPPTVGDEDNEE